MLRHSSRPTDSHPITLTPAELTAVGVTVAGRTAAVQIAAGRTAAVLIAGGLAAGLLGWTAARGIDSTDAARWATLLLLAPLAEETLFRRGLQQALWHRWGRRGPGARAANVATALVFAAAHAVLHPGVLAWATVVPALVIGRVFERRARLLPCIGLHALFNAGWLLDASHRFAG
jgi:membrane protease YdiL (CAAX protease family)